LSRLIQKYVKEKNCFTNVAYYV